LRQYAAAYKATIIFLPPYPPDYSRIEHIWANLKRFLRETKMAFDSLSSYIIMGINIKNIFFYH